MIRMSQLTCAANATVLLDGNDAQDNRTIDAFQNGCSVMEKMIAETTGMLKQIRQFWLANF